MEKSLSLKLAAKKHTRYITWLSLAVLMFMFGSMIIVKNPRGTDAATLVSGKELPHPVYSPAVVYNPNDQNSYVIGGWFNVVQKVDMTFQANPVDVGVLADDGCTNEIDMPAILDTAAQKAYTFGGMIGHGVTNRITQLDIALLKTSPATSAKCTTGTGTTFLSVGGIGSFTARTGAAAAFDPTNYNAYIFGGSSTGPSGGYLKEVFQFNTGTLQLTKLTPNGIDLLGNRSGAGAVFNANSGKAYIFGGSVCTTSPCRDGLASASDDILEFSPPSGSDPNGTITNISHDGTIFTARVPKAVVMDNVNSTAYIIGSSLYRDISGTRTYTETNDVIKFNTTSKSIIKTNKTGPLLNWYTGAFYNNAIYTFGGWEDIGWRRGTVGSIYKIDLASGSTTSPASGVRIKKTLSAINRMKTDGTYPPSNTSFNPYALQKGDIIKVELTITGASGTYSITDTPLKIPSGSGGPGAGNSNIKCDPEYSGHPAISNLGFMSGSDVAWSVTLAPGVTTTSVNYYCKVIAP